MSCEQSCAHLIVFNVNTLTLIQVEGGARLVYKRTTTNMEVVTYPVIY